MDFGILQRKGGTCPPRQGLSLLLPPLNLRGLADSYQLPQARSGHGARLPAPATGWACANPLAMLCHPQLVGPAGEAAVGLLGCEGSWVEQSLGRDTCRFLRDAFILSQSKTARGKSQT